MGANVFQTTTVSREKAEKSMRIYHLGGRFIINMLCELDVHITVSLKAQKDTWGGGVVRG